MSSAISVSGLSAAPSKMAYSLDSDRQCRAHGHVFERDFRHPDGAWESQISMDGSCFRCGVLKAELVVDNESPRD